MRVLHELIAGLDLDQGEIAVGLLRLYEYTLWQLREGNVEEVRQRPPGAARHLGEGPASRKRSGTAARRGSFPAPTGVPGR